MFAFAIDWVCGFVICYLSSALIYIVLLFVSPRFLICTLRLICTSFSTLKTSCWTLFCFCFNGFLWFRFLPLFALCCCLFWDFTNFEFLLRLVKLPSCSSSACSCISHLGRFLLNSAWIHFSNLYCAHRPRAGQHILGYL